MLRDVFLMFRMMKPRFSQVRTFPQSWRTHILQNNIGQGALWEKYDRHVCWQMLAWWMVQCVKPPLVTLTSCARVLFEQTQLFYFWFSFLLIQLAAGHAVAQQHGCLPFSGRPQWSSWLLASALCRPSCCDHFAVNQRMEAHSNLSLLLRTFQ